MVKCFSKVFFTITCTNISTKREKGSFDISRYARHSCKAPLTHANNNRGWYGPRKRCKEYDDEEKK